MREILYGSFVVYVLLVAALTLAPPPFSMSNGGSGINLVPVLPSVACFVADPGQPSTTTFCLRTLAGNLLLFFPLGVLLPLVSARLISAARMLLVALAASATIEILQLVGTFLGSPRWTDVDDVLLNVAGALAGYACFRIGRFIVRNAKGGTRTPTDFSTGS